MPQQAWSVPGAFRCSVSDRPSVEARFGMINCRPRGADSHCDVELGKWALHPNGAVQLGCLAVAADHVLGEVPFLRRPPNTWSLTTELTLDFVAPIEPGTRLHVWGRPTRVDVGGGFADGEILDEDGNVMAVCSTRTIVVPSTPSAAIRVEASDVEHFSAAANFDDYLALLWCDGDGDAVAVRMKDPSAWRNEFGMLHGGIWACLAEVAASRLIARRRPGLVMAGMRTVYLRPCASEVPVTVTARLRHNGSRLAVADCAGRSEDGTLCTLSTVTARHILVSPASEERH